MPKNSDKFYVERLPDGRYAATRGGAAKASFVAKTQRLAGAKAHKSDPTAPVLAERVRNTSGGSRDKWRRLF
jgi:hypothetical protein